MKKKTNLPKIILQWGVLAAITGTILWAKFGNRPVDVEKYCPFGGLQALSTYLHSNSLACTMSMLQIMMGITLAAGVILFGRLFCGYLCPLGTVTELLGKAGRKCRCSIEPRQGAALDIVLRALKYALLFTIFYFTIQSSELFCKRLDPYYAVATGFKGEIVAWMAATSLTLLFLGSFFVRMFWCRYICPLGATGNILKFSVFFLVTVAAGAVLTRFEIADLWMWLLGALCAGGWMLEVIRMRSCAFPLMHVTCDRSKCNNCGRCTKKCPYAIKIESDKVRHIDCTLCGNCVAACHTGALQVNRRPWLRWAPAVLAVALFALAVVLGNKWELPTIDEKWGDYESVENMQTFKMDGLRTVKCFGSSKALAAKLQGVDGVYGLKTYVRRHGIEVLYDPAVTDDRRLQEVLFTPTLRKYSMPGEDVPELQCIELGVEGIHDKMDIVYFGLLFMNREGIYGFTSEFDCPVRVTLFADPAAGYDRKRLAQIVGTREYMMPNAKPDTKPIEMHFDLKTCEVKNSITRDEFARIMFEDVTRLNGRFTENNAKWGDSEQYPEAVYEVTMPEIEKAPIRAGFPFFKSFLSTCDGILGVEFVLRDYVPVLRVSYVKSMWSDERLWNEIFKAEKWTLRMADGSFRESTPRLDFRTEGRTVEQE